MHTFNISSSKATLEANIEYIDVATCSPLITSLTILSNFVVKNSVIAEIPTGEDGTV